MTVPRRVSLLYKFSNKAISHAHELLLAKSYPLLVGLQIFFFLLSKVTILISWTNHWSCWTYISLTFNLFNYYCADHRAQRSYL